MNRGRLGAVEPRSLGLGDNKLVSVQETGSGTQRDDSPAGKVSKDLLDS